jgi:uncharacterized protein YybS (DUF2232 family)
MSEIVLQDSNIKVITKTGKVDPKTLLTKKNDIKFLIDISIMAMLNVMLVTWQPLIEIPITIGLLIFSQIMRMRIKKFKLENNL